jgi:REP element-mobilizing transposase RayT
MANPFKDKTDRGEQRVNEVLPNPKTLSTSAVGISICKRVGMPYFNPEIHHRKSIRLAGHDYSSPGYYFVTICLDNIRCMLAVASSGQTVGAGHGQPLRQKHFSQLRLMPIGEIAKKYWMEIPDHFPNVVVDEFVIMPDHVHGILKIRDAEARNMVGVGHGQPLPKSPTRSNIYQHIIPKSLGTIINHYKSAVTRWCRQNDFPQFKWQRSFHDHVLRDEQSLFQIRQYIQNNPADWVLHGENHLGNELNGWR